jgi:DNA-binding transcriptional LysR family regulator
MDRLLSMRTFSKVVDEGSFAGAARRLSLNQAVVTRLVADLEAHLGTRLLHRTTRSLSLTDAGERYLQRCRQILTDVDSAEEAVSDGETRIGGRVRVAVPAYFGLQMMAPRAPRFRERFPDIVMDISLLDRPVDLVTEGYDIAVIPSSFSVPNSLISRPLGKKLVVLCASAEYLNKAGTPTRPEQLLEHACLGYNLSSGREQWRLANAAGEVVQLTPSFRLQSNSMAFVNEAIRAGMGIGPQVEYNPCPHPKGADLVRVLPDWQLGSFELNIVYPSREYLPRRIRAVLDFFIEERDALAAQGELAIDVCKAATTAQVLPLRSPQRKPRGAVARRRRH